MKPFPNSAFYEFVTLNFQGNISKCSKALKLSRPTVYKYLYAGTMPKAVDSFVESSRAVPLAP